MKELTKNQESVIFHFFYFGKLHKIKKWERKSINHFIRLADFRLTEFEINQCVLEVIELMPFYNFKLVDNNKPTKVSK